MKLRISIRTKLLVTILVVLLLAMGTFLYLATSLFTRDKLAYTYDLNSALVETLSEQTRSNLTILIKELNLFFSEVLGANLAPEARDAAAEAWLAQEGDILRVEVFRRTGPRQRFTRWLQFFNPAALEDSALAPEDLDQSRKERPLPVDALSQKEGRVYLHNSSLPPDAAILTIATVVKTDRETFVLAADFRHQRLLRIFGRSRLHEAFLVDERGEILAHPDANKVIERTGFSNHALVRETLETSIGRGVKEFKDDQGRLQLGSYARVGLGRLVVLAQIPKGEALRASRELIRRSILFGLAILIVAFIASVFFSRLLTAPIRKLRSAAAAVGEGRYNLSVDVNSRDEIGELARAFERMAAAVRDTQEQLVRSEKLAAFGQLGAGITHEVKNPMTGIIGFAQVAQQHRSNPAKVQELLKLIESEAQRCNEILVNFLSFARRESKEFERLDVNHIVEGAAKIISHHLQVHKVRLRLDLGKEIPPVSGNAGELQQVILNLALNAQQEMPQGGEVRLSTRRDEDNRAVISVTDTGPGIPEELRQRIFEPFFTTKPPGEGTGLGLSISHGIVQDHKGTISIQSEPGEGSTFSIHLPACPG